MCSRHGTSRLRWGWGVAISRESFSIDHLNTELLRRVQIAEDLVHQARPILGEDHSGDCSIVQSWIDECREAIADPAPVSVALLGSTGAGKSTLINSLIGAQVLPTSSLAVCTSAITRVRYAPDEKYFVDVELVPRATWEKQLEQASADIQASRDADPEAEAYVATSPVPEDEKKRISAVYGDDAFAEFLRTGQRSALVEPQEIQDAFESKFVRISADTTEELRLAVSRYLTSKDNFWPIVRTCLIQGPFDSLKHGGELVDLPGLNDPNEAREELTRNYLETARFVWVIFNMKRSLGKDLTQVLESRDLINRLLAGGRLSTLTFVGTHSDDVSSVNPDDFGLAEEATAADVALARNEMAEKELRTNLATIAQAIALGGQQDSISRELENQFVNSPVFMVSASNFLQMSGKTKSRVPVVFAEPYETNVPQLGNHLKGLAIEAGPRSNAFSLVTTLEKVVSELASVAQTLKTQKTLQAQEGEKAKRELLAEVKHASEVLHKDSKSAVDRLRGSLQEAVLRFKKTSAIDKAVVERIVEARASRWNSMHWATMRATANRGGRFTSSSAGEVDFVRELSAPLIGKAIGPWKEFFEQDLPSLTHQVSDGLKAAVEQYSSCLSEAGEKNEDLKRILATLLPDLASDVSDSVESALLLVSKELRSEMSRRQQELHSVTERAIERSMEPIFAQAAAQRGTGMKVRMVSILANGSRSAISDAVDEFEESLVDLTEKAISSVVDRVGPVVSQIGEKVSRINTMLTETRQSADSGTVAEIDVLLSSLSAARTGICGIPDYLTTDLRRDTDSPTETQQIEVPAGFQRSEGKLLVVDASNVARSLPGEAPDVFLLMDCVSSLKKEFPDHEVLLVADASLRHLVKNQSGDAELEQFDSMIRNQLLVEVPAGTPGKADRLILQIAGQKRAIIVSNDSYKEFQNDNHWLFEGERLLGHTYHRTIGWQFTTRKPVRARSY